MSADARARAAALEAAGDADGAAREYAAAGAHDEAARVFTLAMRPLDAAIALLAGIDMIGSELEPAQRSRAQLAASLLREGGRDDHARLVLGAIGGSGPAFPSAVLKSVLNASQASEAPRPSLRSSPSASSPSTSATGSSSGARRSASAFVVRAPIEERVTQPGARTSGTGAASPFLKPAGASGTGVASPFLRPAGEPRPAVAPSTPSDHARTPVPPKMEALDSERPTALPPPTTTTPPSGARASGAGVTPPRRAEPIAPAPESAPARAAIAMPIATPTATSSARTSPPPASPAPASPAPASSKSAPRSSASSEAVTTPGTTKSPRKAGADGGDHYRAEAGWHAADGAAIEETIRQFLSTGRKGAAARVAWEGGQFERALPWFVELGLKYQAGSCLRSLGRNEEALTTLLEVPMDDSRYRRACFDVAALAKATGRLDFEVDRFLTAFVGEGPKDGEECEAFLELAELYAGAGFPVGARRCAEGVLRITPDDARAKALARPTATQRARSRPPIGVGGDQTALPPLEEFTALVRKHLPPRPTPRR